MEDDILLRTGAEVEYYVLPSLYLTLDQELRSKAEVSYKFFSKPLMPYISYELCNTLNHSPYISGNYICGNRYEAGLKWRLTQELALDFFYRYDVGRNYDIDINKKETKVEMTPESSSIQNFGVYLDVAFK